MVQAAAPRIETIEGRPTLVVERRPPLPAKFDKLLASMLGLRRYEVRTRGARRDCDVLRDHRFAIFGEGRHVGLDAIIRDLRLLMCVDCSAVCVRDVSIDRLAGLAMSRRGPARRDLVLGWYSGARRNRREYR